MRRMLLGLAVLVWISTTPAFAKGKGAKVDLDFTQAPLHDLLRLLADVSRLSVVPVGVGPVKIDAKYKLVPWDDVLPDLVKRANLAWVREGTVALVGDPAMIEARKKQQRRAFKGPTVDVDLVDASGPAVAALLAKLGRPVELVAPARPVSVRLKRVPLDQAADVISFAAGATLRAAGKPSSQKGCIAPDRPAKELRLAGIGRIGTKRHAVLVQGAQAVAISMGDCLGSDQLSVKDVGELYVTFATSGTPSEDFSMPLYPRALSEN